MLKFYTFVLVFLISSCLTSEEMLQKGILQVQPSALDSLRNYFDILVIYLKQNSQADETNFITAVADLNRTVPHDNRLFGIVNMQDDVQNSLKKYNFEGWPSVQIITKRKVYSYTGDRTWLGLTTFYKRTLTPTLKLVDHRDVPERSLIFNMKDPMTESSKFQKTYHSLVETILQAKLSVVGTTGAIISPISINIGGEVVEYTGDIDDVNSINQFIISETMPLVFQVNEDNFQEVFGSHLSTQVLLIYNNTISSSELSQYLSIMQHASILNRKQDLRYQRMVFGTIPMKFAQNFFGDLIEDLSDVKYKIIITKTDYEAFQLERYLYNKQSLTTELLRQFMEDYRMKRLQPFYKSQKMPERQEGPVFKVVGKSFQEFVYGQRQSVTILFIDGKAPESYSEWKEKFEGFAIKYESLTKDKLKFGIFDLAHNEHKSLHLDFAPQIVLFERTNKKRARSFRGEVDEDNLRDWFNYWIKELEIPDNFGKEPLSLGL